MKWANSRLRNSKARGINIKLRDPKVKANIRLRDSKVLWRLQDTNTRIMDSKMRRINTRNMDCKVRRINTRLREGLQDEEDQHQASGETPR